jgi:regulator of PEP synthase PpsR (kinase-PPPase family)
MSHERMPAIYIVSGGAGASGEQLVHTVLAQFPQRHVQVNTLSNVRDAGQLESIVHEAHMHHAIIVHTLVNKDLRRVLRRVAKKEGVPAVDLVHDLQAWLEKALNQPARGEPGLYRQLNRAYFERIGAIEYALAHDDGRNPDGWTQADIVLTGVSRSGKSPLSMYLSVLGWKVANVPIVPELEMPAQFNALDPRRVIGLTIEPDRLLSLRQQRFSQIAAMTHTDYLNLERIAEELAFAKRLFKQRGFVVIDVTDKPIESSADHVIRLITSKFGAQAGRGDDAPA